jgi:hypothetical protein
MRVENVGYRVNRVLWVLCFVRAGYRWSIPNEEREADMFVDPWDVASHFLSDSPKPTEEFRRDIGGRELVCTPFEGAYGFAGWVFAIDGSPPRGIFVVQPENLGETIFIHGRKTKQLRCDSAAGQAVRRFYETHLVGQTGVCRFKRSEIQ